MLRDPDLLVYYREDGDGLVMGGYERHSRPAFLPHGTGGFDAIPPDFNGRLLEEEWDRFEEITRNSQQRVPAIAEVKVTKLINESLRPRGWAGQMLNRRGGIECDFTVARLGEERFGIVTGTAFGNHDREWMRRHLPDDGSARIADVTSQWACFGIWGPRARAVLAPMTPADLSNDAFPYMSLREITVGDVPVRALRVTYVGELGWELYCPTEYGLGLWRAIWEAGSEHGVVAGGYRAIDSMRLEKGYRVWGADITPDETPYEGGAGFCAKLDKDEFVGREALVAAKEKGPRQRLACITLDDPRRVAFGNEPVRVDGEVVGRVTTGGYGYTVESSIAYAYLPAALAAPGTAVAIEIFGTWVEGEVAAEPLFDQAGERIRS